MGDVADDRARARFLAEVLKALAHPERLRIVAALCERDTNVIGLAERLDLGQAVVSQHLRILRMAGLVAAERRAGHALYGLARPRLRDLVACLDRCDAAEPAGAETAAGASRRRKL